MISKEKLNFNPALPDASDTVGSYLLSSDGTALTHTTVGADEALDVNLVQSVDLVVTATDLDIRDLAFATDSVDVSGSAVSITGDVNVTQGTSPWVVSATDLDIRNLVFATDKVDASGSVIALDAASLAALESITVQNPSGAGAVNIQDGGNSLTIDDGGASLTVDAVDLDIRNLSAAQDNVQSWLHDGAGTSLTSTTAGAKQALDVNIAASDIEINVENDAANVALLSTQKTVTSTGALLASQLASRRFLLLQNLGADNIFIGASGVSSATGIRMSPGAVAEFRLGPALSLHAVSTSTADTRMLEMA